MDLEMNVGHGIIRSYRRLSYRSWYALAEFIDNATQSYAEHKHELEKAGDVPPLQLNIDYDKDHLRITDNAMGMNRDELERAVRVGVAPLNTSGRSEYGLGMKTAACWFGDYWTLTTKRLGETTEYEVTVDVDRVAQGKIALPTIVRENKDPAKHYTSIEIRKLHHKYHHKTKKRIEMYIRSMYRLDLEDANLWITINSDQPLTKEEPLTYLTVRGKEYRRDFEMKTTSGKVVKGWLGILNPGERRSAGIAVIRRGRAIKAQPDAWRPVEIYGIELNNLLNQRLVGEVHLNEFGISHTKDEILWDDEEEHEVVGYLDTEFKEYIQVARRPKKEFGDPAGTGPTSAEEQLGLSELRQHMESGEFADEFNLQEVPTDDIVRKANAPLIDTAKREDAAQVIRIGQGDRQVVCKIHLNDAGSPNDPYFASDYPGASEVLVSINRKHPHYLRIRGGVAGVMAYYMECVYDALAEWKAMHAHNVNHGTVKLLKDGLLRQDIAMDSAEEESSPEEGATPK